MSLSKYSKRRGQFEALEAKQLFAADFVGGAAADLPDTAIVAKPDNTEGYRCHACGLCGDYQMPAANLPQISTDTLTPTQSFENEERELLHTAAHEAAHLTHQFGGQEGEPIADPVLDRVLENLGGQEGEPIIDPISDMVLENLGGQEGEDFTTEGITGDSAALVAVDRVFSMGAIRIPMTVDTSGIGAVDVSRIPAVDLCALSQGALRLI